MLSEIKCPLCNIQLFDLSLDGLRHPSDGDCSYRDLILRSYEWEKITILIQKQHYQTIANDLTIMNEKLFNDIVKKDKEIETLEDTILAMICVMFNRPVKRHDEISSNELKYLERRMGELGSKPSESLAALLFELRGSNINVHYFEGVTTYATF